MYGLKAKHLVPQKKVKSNTQHNILPQWFIWYWDFEALTREAEIITPIDFRSHICTIQLQSAVNQYVFVLKKWSKQDSEV